MPEKTEMEKLLEVVEEPSMLDRPLTTEQVTTEAPVEETTEADEMKLKNRRERRLAEKLQAERESNIALNAKVEALAEAARVRGDSQSDYQKKIERIYGTNSPEAQEATNLLAEALKGVKEEAREEALAAIRAEQEKTKAAEREATQTLESYVDAIEDENNVVLSAAEQQGFFKMLEKLSPKDRDGNITEYADPHAVWDIYKDRLQKKDTRAKDLSSRSMVSGGATNTQQTVDDAQMRQLKELGIL